MVLVRESSKHGVVVLRGHWLASSWILLCSHWGKDLLLLSDAVLTQIIVLSTCGIRSVLFRARIGVLNLVQRARTAPWVSCLVYLVESKLLVQFVLSW